MNSKYWEVLGIEYTKDLKLIKAAYAKMIKQCKNDHEKFLEVNTAYKEIKKILEAGENQELFITTKEDIDVIEEKPLEQPVQMLLIEIIKEYEFQNTNIKEDSLRKVYQNLDLEGSIRELSLLKSYFEYHLEAYKKINAYKIYDLLKDHSIENLELLEYRLKTQCLTKFIDNIEKDEYFSFLKLRNDFRNSIMSNDFVLSKKLIREAEEKYSWSGVEIPLFKAVLKLQQFKDMKKSSKDFATIYLKYQDTTALNYLLLLLIFSGKGFKYQDGFIYVNILSSKLKIKLDSKKLRMNSLIPIRIGKIYIHENSHLDILAYIQNDLTFIVETPKKKTSLPGWYWLIFVAALIAFNVLRSVNRESSVVKTTIPDIQVEDKIYYDAQSTEILKRSQLRGQTQLFIDQYLLADNPPNILEDSFNNKLYIDIENREELKNALGQGQVQEMSVENALTEPVVTVIFTNNMVLKVFFEEKHIIKAVLE